jgi:hypothetical protein
MKLDWKKQDKGFYLPKSEPELVKIPPLKYFTIHSEGNPNNEFFASCISVLYSLSYAVKMSPKGGYSPKDYYEYSMYPLEGIWDISESVKSEFGGKMDKNSLIFTLLMRQPNFVDEGFAREIEERIGRKTPNAFMRNVKFEILEESECVQMMHIGGYDSEFKTFEAMNEFSKALGLVRLSGKHKEIYISDPKRTSPEKLKTVLRYQVGRV